MTSPLVSDPNPRATRRWLDGQLRGGGVAAYVPLILPLLSGVLLLGQASLMAHVLHRVIVAGDGLALVVSQLILIGALLAGRVALGLVSEIAATRASETIKWKLRAMLA